MASVIVIFAGQEQKTYDLSKPRMVVGREPACDIHIDNLGISRNHCAFLVTPDAFKIQDLGSSNGTYVNGHKITEHFLNDGDEIIIGKYTLKFKNQAQVAAAPEKAASGGPDLPDTLNTYVMDGAAIQKQLEQMRKATAGGAPPKTAKEYAQAMDPGHAHASAPAPSPAPGGEVNKMKAIVGALVAVVVVLLIVVVLFVLGVIKIGGGQ